MKTSTVLASMLAAGMVLSATAAQAGSRGVWPRTTAYDEDWSGRPVSNHPFPWQYHSQYPWAETSTYHAGPGAYYPAHRYRKRQARGDYRWTGYPPRHFYVVDYNGYAPAYGFPAETRYAPYRCPLRC